MNQSTEEEPKYRPRTGRIERKYGAAATPATPRRSEPRAEKSADRGATKKSFFKDRTPGESARPAREKSFSDRPPRAPYDRERKPFADRPSRPPYDRERKPFGDRPSRAPYDRERKPFADRPSRPPYDRERKPFSDRPSRPPYDRERKSFSDRPFRPPYDRERKPFSDRPSRPPYDREKKPFADRPAFGGGGYKARPYEKKYAPRTAQPFRAVAPKQRPPRPRTDTDMVRLNKFIANSGICSRREADEYIVNGEITVNGQVVTTLGTKIAPADVVKFHDQKLSGEKKVYLLLNKPKGYVTTQDDPHAKHTVMELVENACKERIYPVGRLDKNTTGVLLFTNDGELTKRLTHPSYNRQKLYHVFLDKNVSKEDVERLVKGVTLEDGIAAADQASYVDEQTDRSQIGIEIHSGKNRVVRRMFEQLGYEVKKLDRVLFAGLTKKTLERGRWRMLTPKEITMLKMN